MEAFELELDMRTAIQYSPGLAFTVMGSVISRTPPRLAVEFVE
jgi:hypothetical protein